MVGIGPNSSAPHPEEFDQVWLCIETNLPGEATEESQWGKPLTDALKNNNNNLLLNIVNNDFIIIAPNQWLLSSVVVVPNRYLGGMSSTPIKAWSLFRLLFLQ